MKFLKYLQYLTIAIKFISAADRAEVLPTIKKALKDHKLSANEMIDISKRICQAAGIDLDTAGIDL
jgi:hypothetical protein